MRAWVGVGKHATVIGCDISAQRERERDRDREGRGGGGRQTDRMTDRERQTDRGNVLKK